MMRKKACAVVKQIVGVLRSSIGNKAKSMGALKTKTNAFKTRIVIFWLLWDKKLVRNSISHKINAFLRLGHGQQHSSQYVHADADADEHHDSHAYESSSSSQDHHHQVQDPSKGKGALALNSIISSIHHGSHHQHPIININDNSNPTTQHEHHYTIESDDYDIGENIDKRVSDDIDDYGYLDVVEAAGVEDDDEEIKNPDHHRHLILDADDDLLFRSVIDIVKSSKQEAGKEFCLEDEIDHVAELFISKFHRQVRMQPS